MEDGRVQCGLCPNHCTLGPGDRGRCKVRENILGRLISENYGRITALHLDPIEKKPLYHFFPGQQILSAGSFGCNFHCGWCQNSSISQARSEDFLSLQPFSPHHLARKAIEGGGVGLAYTYNEPVVWFEFMMDCAGIIREAGKKNVVVSNGYIQPRPLEELLEVTDAFNIDLKAFSPLFYEKYCGGSLDSVKQSLVAIARRNIHLEVTFLAIPGFNDDLELFREMVQWLAGELGEHIPLHISRYFPCHYDQQPPPPVSLLKRMFETASENLHFVYLGNVAGFPEMSSTRCPGCGQWLAQRNGYSTRLFQVDESGHCRSCSEKVFER